MVNMSISEGDRSMFLEYTNALLNRRKQLAPWPFTDANQVKQLYMDPVLYSTLNKLNGHTRDQVWSWLHLQRYFDVSVPGVKKGELVTVRVSDTDGLLCLRMGKGRAVTTTEYWPEFYQWTKQATRIELTNQLIHATVKRVVRRTTTFKQLTRALPETMKAVAQHIEVSTSQWHYNRPRKKYVEVMKELGDDGGARARAMPSELQQILLDRRSLIEGTMAQAVMLPNVNELGDHPWRDTWVAQLYLQA